MGCRSICYGAFQYLLCVIAVSPIGVRQILRRVMAATATNNGKHYLMG